MIWKLRHKKISIHALREEGDVRRTGEDAYTLVFLSTPSARRATAQSELAERTLNISIHALREEGDHSWSVEVW